MRKVLIVVTLLVLCGAVSAKADGPELWRQPITWNFDLHFYGAHYGYAGPYSGCCVKHVNWVIHYHPYGYWNNYRMRTMCNVHASIHNNCEYFWDSVTCRHLELCKPGGSIENTVNSLATGSQQFARRFGIYIPWGIAVYLAWLEVGALAIH
jgi:hypothetical protein